jgi:diaminopimelate epimerase
LILRFSKFHGTGNDFIIADNTDNRYYWLEEHDIKSLCTSKFNIGADGLILIEKHEQHDFFMRYFNADGKPGSFCGNGSRCAVAFALHNKISRNKERVVFDSFDGLHYAAETERGISVSMNDVNEINYHPLGFVLDTGSPHLVIMKDDIEKTNVFDEGRRIRYSAEFAERGININFVQLQVNKLHIRTYERGVENETLSCGTGVTAAAICYNEIHPANGNREIEVNSPGGTLWVNYSSETDGYRNIRLEGPATHVFDGIISIKRN